MSLIICRAEIVVRRAVIGTAANATVPVNQFHLSRVVMMTIQISTLTKHPLPVRPGPSYICDTHPSREYDQDPIRIKCGLDIQISTKPGRNRCH
jgi:hypothetical protein